MIRRPGLVLLAVAVLCRVAFGQATAPLPSDADLQSAPIDLSYPTQEEATTPQVVQDASQQKIIEVNRVLEQAANPAPAAESVTVESGEWTPLENALRAVFGLLAALALLFLLGYLAKRFGKHSPLFAGGNLARIMGKVYLSPKASLHFVRTGGKILVVGVTPNAISLVAEFEEDTFQTEPGESGEGPAAKTAESDTESFLAQFKASLETIAKSVPAEPLEEGDAEIAALREDVQRLQRYLQETVRGENR